MRRDLLDSDPYRAADLALLAVAIVVLALILTGAI